jgi:hypothetical protein
MLVEYYMLLSSLMLYNITGKPVDECIGKYPQEPIGVRGWMGPRAILENRKLVAPADNQSLVTCLSVCSLYWVGCTGYRVL